MSQRADGLRAGPRGAVAGASKRTNNNFLLTIDAVRPLIRCRKETPFTVASSAHSYGIKFNSKVSSSNARQVQFLLPLILENGYPRSDRVAALAKSFFFDRLGSASRPKLLLAVTVADLLAIMVAWPSSKLVLGNPVIRRVRASP